ncbi:uncharacterized protein [Paramisgurnus dabryanus]|uniref:uncharacterized protein n=1 Tax=Paramisgurnus dabryanus TaxID=90735 RepID=UPI003CCF1AB8
MQSLPHFFSTGTAGETHVFSSSGENVTLPCNNDLFDCTSTTWDYSKHRSSVTVELVNGGIKKINVKRAERLSLGSDCSLNIYKTTKEDRGQYTCRQYVNRQTHTDAQIFLHVLHVSLSSIQTEMRSGSSVTLTCQLFTYGNHCDGLVHIEGIQLFWVNQADVNLQTDSRYQILSPGKCIITLTTTLLNEDNNRKWRCLVKKKNDIKTSASYTVKFKGPAVTNPPITTTNFETKSTTNASETEGSKIWVSLYRVIIVIIEITAFTAPTVIVFLIICTGRAAECASPLLNSGNDHRILHQHLDGHSDDKDKTLQLQQLLFTDTAQAEPCPQTSLQLDCESTPKDVSVDNNNHGMHDNTLSQPSGTPESQLMSSHSLSLSPTSPLLCFSEKMEKLVFAGTKLSHSIAASPQISTKKRRAPQPPKPSGPAQPALPLHLREHSDLCLNSHLQTALMSADYRFEMSADYRFEVGMALCTALTTHSSSLLIWQF